MKKQTQSTPRCKKPTRRVQGFRDLGFSVSAAQSMNNRQVRKRRENCRAIQFGFLPIHIGKCASCSFITVDTSDNGSVDAILYCACESCEYKVHVVAAVLRPADLRIFANNNSSSNVPQPKPASTAATPNIAQNSMVCSSTARFPVMTLW